MPIGGMTGTREEKCCTPLPLDSDKAIFQTILLTNANTKSRSTHRDRKRRYGYDTDRLYGVPLLQTAKAVMPMVMVSYRK